MFETGSQTLNGAAETLLIALTRTLSAWTVAR